MKTELRFDDNALIRILESMPAHLPARVNQALLKQHDQHPVFAEIKIGKVGAVSRNTTRYGNQRRYERTAWESIVESINAGTITGQMGHMSDYERATSFEKPVVYWVSAQIESSGDVKAVAYFAPGDGRDHLVTTAALGMPFATSLYANAVESESGEVIDVELEQIDVVNALRAGLLDAVDDRPQLFTVKEERGKIHITIKDKRNLELLREAMGVGRQQSISEQIADVDAQIAELDAAIAAYSGPRVYIPGEVWADASRQEKAELDANISKRAALEARRNMLARGHDVKRYGLGIIPDPERISLIDQISDVDAQIAAIPAQEYLGEGFYRERDPETQKLYKSLVEQRDKLQHQIDMLDNADDYHVETFGGTVPGQQRRNAIVPGQSFEDDDDFDPNNSVITF